ncbi:contact-dependent growth inhibition system immunity protein [Actinoplanes sp. NPDC051494]|uniref:contact-dependent growth inhibition system immunity protein n=1 Tax=Actinoplanes sp. NPDC051494 TaxID=3363907 RepID=UPI003789D198
MRDLSLEQMEGDVWGDAPPGSPPALVAAHELRRRPMSTLGPGDLRLLVDRGIGLSVLMPRVLTLLTRDAAAHADLVAAVVGVPGEFWTTHPAEHARLRVILGWQA